VAVFCKTKPKMELKSYFANCAPLAACVKIGFRCCDDMYL